MLLLPFGFWGAAQENQLLHPRKRDEFRGAVRSIMSVRLLAMELYKVQQKVSALEEELQNPAIPDEKKVRDELRVAKAEQQVLRKMLDGEKGTVAIFIQTIHTAAVQVIHLHNLVHPTLRVDDLHIGQGQSWFFAGRFDSAVDACVRFFEGRLQNVSCERCIFPSDIHLITFHTQQQLYEEELRNDDSDFLDYPDPGTLVREFFDDIDGAGELLDLFGLMPLLDQGYRQLSTGQGRKLLLAKALMAEDKALFIERPYEGLDVKSCELLVDILRQQSAKGRTMILTGSLLEDIPSWIDNVALFDQGSLFATGAYAEMRSEAGTLLQGKENIFVADTVVQDLKEGPTGDEELIRLVNGGGWYGDKQIFGHLDLVVRTGQHTLLTGSNGAGKSTLLQIIAGDHPSCYANELYLFGHRRGSGESIWELKKDMGLMSSDLHRNYRVSMNVLLTVVSGLYDSIGVYRRVSDSDRRKAMRWLTLCGLHDLSQKRFTELDFSRQRLVLIVRALIKMPRLLILDEPTQGLDEAGRSRLLDFLQMIAAKNLCTLLYVSHRTDEYRSFFKQRIHLDDYRSAA